MKNSELKKLRHESAGWTTFSRSWDDVPIRSASLVVDRKVAKSLEPLSRFKHLRRLFVHGLREQDFPHVAALAGLKALLVWKLDADHLRGLSPLINLESLGVYHASKLKSLSGLSSLSSIRHLFFHHVPNLRSLDPIGRLKALEEIVIEQSLATDKPLRFATLGPLANLQRLKCVDLRGVHVEDGSLATLGTLPNLRHLFPGTYAADINELAKLGAKINSQLAREDRITPTRKIQSDDHFGKCRKCGSLQLQLVGRVGPKYRLLACPICDKQLIEERKSIFESISESSVKKKR